MEFKVVLSYLVYLIYVYFISTNIEYMFHRFMMHDDKYFYGKSHVTHHKHTDNEMNLIYRNTKDYEDIGESENLIFELPEVLGISVVLYLLVYLFYFFYPIKINIYFIVLIPLIPLIYAVIMWNSIHPHIHYKCGKDYTPLSLPCDITKYLAENNSFVKWLVNNHKKHHIYKGDKKGNFSVTLPGADFLYNTYN